MGFLKKTFKKIAKGIKKVAKKVVKVQKKVWKGIKKVGGKIMKAINKAGIIGQIGLMLVMPYAMAGIGSLVGGAAGGLSATWTGFGNWASSMMGSSNAFAQAVGGIARGVYHAGATAGKIIKGVSSFIDTGFTRIAEATGLPNPIEGFSNAVKSGYTKSFSATNNFLFGSSKYQATASQLKAAGVQVDTSFTDKFLEEATKPAFDEKGFNVEKMKSLEAGELSGEIYQPIGQVRYNEATGTYSDILGNEFNADLNGNFTPVDTLKAGEINLEAGKGMEAKYKYDPLKAGTVTAPGGKSKVRELMENVQDFAEQKATEYASKWVSNKIDENIYGAGDDYSTSIGFNPWEEEGVGITAQNFFTQGDSYTTSLATFYDQASRAFDNTGLNTQALANIGR